MFDVVLLFHSYLRWIVLALAVLSFVTALTGWLGQRTWRASDEQRHQGFMMALDVQVLLGLVLYVFLSPTSKAAFADWETAMGNTDLRFWGLQHTVAMVLAAVAAHVGKAMSERKKGTDRHMPMVIGLVVFTFFILTALSHGRPLFRGI